jgi:flavin reductase (DIM6/NTAB) family NADH-FMN oxidoreductase RutF
VAALAAALAAAEKAVTRDYNRQDAKVAKKRMSLSSDHGLQTDGVMAVQISMPKESPVGMVRIDNNVSIYPMPVVLAGAMVGEQANFLAVGWISRVNSQPPMLAMALNKRHFTNGGIREHREFSVNVPGMDLLEKVDYCGLISGREADKSKLFNVFYGKLRAAPLIRECSLCMACTLVEMVPLPSNDLFIGEIVEAYAEEECLTAGNPDISKMQPFTLTMPDNIYWMVGEKAGKAWEAGRKLIM